MWKLSAPTTTEQVTMLYIYSLYVHCHRTTSRRLRAGKTYFTPLYRLRIAVEHKALVCIVVFFQKYSVCPALSEHVATCLRIVCGSLAVGLNELRVQIWDETHLESLSCALPRLQCALHGASVKSKRWSMHFFFRGNLPDRQQGSLGAIQRRKRLGTRNIARQNFADFTAKRTFMFSVLRGFQTYFEDGSTSDKRIYASTTFRKISYFGRTSIRGKVDLILWFWSAMWSDQELGPDRSAILHDSDYIVECRHC